MVNISVLGPIVVRRVDESLTVPTGKASQLLIRLALDAGEVVSAERLVDQLWADDAVNTRRNTLQSKIAMLRRALGSPALIISSDGGYRLAVDRSVVDALAVMQHATTASRLLGAGEDHEAVALSTMALEMFRGDVLPAAGDSEWVAPYRARLDEARMSLAETRFSARLRLGDGGDMTGELESAVALYPFREGLWELLITSLYRAGRQAEALAAYQRVRNVLADQLGLDPGPQLRQLEQQILIHHPALGVPEHVRGVVSPNARVGNLPSLEIDLVGREGELAVLCDLIASERLVEIVGPGGVGKTAVAIAVGRRLNLPDGAGPGGVWLATLDSATTPEDVIDAVIAAFAVTGGEPALVERVRGAAALLILDNCEHVLDAAADLAVRLLDAAPGLRILCTSQVPFAVTGEKVVELTPLAMPDAVELFIRRASATRLEKSSDDGLDAIQELCRSLDGLPLAIELAAARTKTLSIEEITRRLDDRFNVLRDPTSRRPERRRALRATIGWSYDLLFPDDQRGLWALATFAGGASLPAVEFILEALDVPSRTVIDVVGRLAARSLVIVDEDRIGDGATTMRYRLLDSIRAYAQEAMTDAGTTERAHASHAAWYAARATTSTAGVRSNRQADNLAFARAERSNIDAALAWCTLHDPLLGLHIVNGFGWAWAVLGDSRGSQRILSALDVVGASAPITDRTNALLLAGWGEASTGDLELARTHIASATELADAAGDAELIARCNYYLAYVVSHHGEFPLAIELTDRSRALYDTLDRPWDQVANGLFAARAAISAGDDAQAVIASEQVQHWLQTVDDPWLHVRNEGMLGELARLQLRFNDAVTHISHAAKEAGRLGFLQTEAYQLSSLGRAYCQAGDYVAGATTLELAMNKAEATGDTRMAALARVHLGRVLRALGQTTQARAALEAACTWHRSAGGGEQAALGECLLAAMDAADHIPGAEQRLREILHQAELTASAHVEVFALDALARIAADTGDTNTARTLHKRANRRMNATAHFITELDRTDPYETAHAANLPDRPAS